MIDYDKHYALLRQWSAAITREEARNLLDAALGDEPLYRKADDCQITKSHSLGEHGKPCLECGAEQMWVLPATKEKQ